MPAVLFVPLGQRCRHVHLLDDVPPTHAGVVSAERDLTLLRGIWDDALLSTAEVVVEQILKPHSSNEQEVPAIAAALFDVVASTIPGHLAITSGGGLLAHAETLVELRNQIGQLKVFR